MTASTEEINTAHLPAGTYLLKLAHHDDVKNTKGFDRALTRHTFILLVIFVNVFSNKTIFPFLNLKEYKNEYRPNSQRYGRL